MFFRFDQFWIYNFRKNYLFLSKDVSKSEVCVLSFHSMLDWDPKNIFNYQHDVQNYRDQVLDFTLFDKHEYTHGIFWSVILVNIIVTVLCNFFLCYSRYDWQNQFEGNSLSKEHASYWLLILCVTSYL